MYNSFIFNTVIIMMKHNSITNLFIFLSYSRYSVYKDSSYRSISPLTVIGYVYLLLNILFYGNLITLDTEYILITKSS